MRVGRCFALALVLLGACSGRSLQPGDSLVDHDLWFPAPIATDPLGDLGEPDCNHAVWQRFTDFLDLDTSGACSWALLTQPLPGVLAEGATVEWMGWHSPLTADEEGEAHFAVAVGEQIVFEQWASIPSGDTTFRGVWTAPERIAEGTAVVVHLHNHGDNGWALRTLSVAE